MLKAQRAFTGNVCMGPFTPHTLGALRQLATLGKTASACDPENNWYGYVDGICQSNGWLQSECTEDAVDPTRFVWFTIGGPRVVRRCNTCASVNVCVLYYRYSMVNVCALYYVSVCVKTNTNTHERWRKNCWIRKTTGYIDTYMNMYVCTQLGTDIHSCMCVKQ